MQHENYSMGQMPTIIMKDGTHANVQIHIAPEAPLAQNVHYSPLMRSYRLKQESSAPQKPLSKIPFSTIYSSDRFKYVIMPGNNSRLIKEAMQRRDWWIETPPFNSMFNFKWQPFSNGIRFDNVTSHNHKQLSLIHI